MRHCFPVLHTVTDNNRILCRHELTEGINRARESTYLENPSREGGRIRGISHFGLMTGCGEA